MMTEIKNRKAYFDYFIEREIECGIVLTGTEVKSIRKGSANLKDTYARIKNGEVFLINMFVSPYDEVMKDGYSLIPLKLYFKGNYAKVLLGLCKGKKLYDKRETIKERDLERENKRINLY